MSKCKKCGMDIQWRKQGSKWIPYSHGVMHWELCKKPITETTVMSKSNGVHVGENYVDVKCDCGVPPWEVCKHSFPEVIEAEMAGMDSIYQKVGAHKTAQGE